MRGRLVRGSGRCRCYGQYLYAFWTWALAVDFAVLVAATAALVGLGSRLYPRVAT